VAAQDLARGEDGGPKIRGTTPCTVLQYRCFGVADRAGKATGGITARNASISWIIRRRSRTRLISAAASYPCFQALRLAVGGPDAAPPCIRQRRPPRNAGARHGTPFRVRAPQRRAADIGTVSRRWLDLPRPQISGRDALAGKQNLSALVSFLQLPPLSWIGVALR